MTPFPGNYTCEVEWSGSAPKQIVHQLEVQVPAQVEAVLPGGHGGLGGLGGLGGTVDRPLEVREGFSVNLECRGDGIPPPIIRWRRPVRNKTSFSI
jgi:hypothetical protein